MDPVAHFTTLARYNAWATARLLDAVARVPEVDYRRDVGLFFRSIHGTLNHLLVGEHQLWFVRFSEGSSPRVALDAEAEPDRAELDTRLRSGAARWEPLIEGVAPVRWEGTLDYTTMRGTVGLRFSIQRDTGRGAFGETHKPQLVLTHQQVVERAVDAAKEQTHIAPVVGLGHHGHRVQQARRGPGVVARQCGEVGNGVHGEGPQPHIRKMPNFDSGMGACCDAASPSASTRRVSAGSMMPSSHSRAVA